MKMSAKDMMVLAVAEAIVARRAVAWRRLRAVQCRSEVAGDRRPLLFSDLRMEGCVMQINREWADEPELFEAVAEALGPQAIARDERDSYGNRGYIVIRTQDGRRFKLLLAEEV